MTFSCKKPQKMMKNMTFFIKKLLPKNYDSAAEDSPSHKINDSAIFQNLRETVERDEEIINVSFCNYFFTFSKMQKVEMQHFCISMQHFMQHFLAIAAKKNRHRTSIAKWLCFICKFYSFVWVIQNDSYCYIFLDTWGALCHVLRVAHLRLNKNLRYFEERISP